MDMEQEIQYLKMRIQMHQAMLEVALDVIKRIDDKIGGPRTTSPVADKYMRQIMNSLAPRKTLQKMDIEQMVLQVKNQGKPQTLNIPDGINEDGTPWTK